jgi:hypothetical protein
MSFPTTSIGGHTVSRLACGSNCFNGFSHFSPSRDAWLRRYMTAERIVEVLAKCSELGVNCLVSSARENMHEALVEHERATGRHLVWISTSNGSPSFDDQMSDIEHCGEWGAEICLIHCGYTDTHLRVADRSVEGLDRLLARVRELGMVPGVSTHRPDTLPACEAAGYDAECYILPLNVIGFLSNLESNWVAHIIRSTPKPVINIKPLAAGRVMPFEGLNFCYRSIKPVDLVAVGLLSPEEAEEDIGIARDILAGLQTDAGLPMTPSKSTVGAE